MAMGNLNKSKKTKATTTIALKVEPVCCKKQQTKVPDQLAVTGLWNRGPLKILNDIKLILDDQGNHLDSYTIIRVLQRSPIPQTSNWSGTFVCCFLQQTGSSIFVSFSLKEVIALRH